MTVRSGFVPPVSPFGLIQETLWPDEWKILVSCVLLNRTTRRAMEKVLPALFAEYPDARSMSQARPDDLAQMTASLGFKNRRAGNLIRLSKEYLGSTWSNAEDLPGIGSYGAAVWQIFCRGELPETCPADGALSKYWAWRKSHADR